MVLPRQPNVIAIDEVQLRRFVSALYVVQIHVACFPSDSAPWKADQMVLTLDEAVFVLIVFRPLASIRLPLLLLRADLPQW